MQSSSKEIYQITSLRTGIGEQIYKDIGNFVQRATAENMKRPKKLIIKLKGIGYWYLRKGRMEKAITYYPSEYHGQEFNAARPFLNLENKHEIYKMFRARLDDYKDYLQAKKEAHAKKDEYLEASEGNS